MLILIMDEDLPCPIAGKSSLKIDMFFYLSKY